MSASIEVKQREAKTVSFTCKEDGVVIDLTGTVLTFKAENKERDAYLVTKDDIDFDKTDQVNGVVKINLSVSDTDQVPDTYNGELQIYFSASNIDKSEDIDYIVNRGII